MKITYNKRKTTFYWKTVIIVLITASWLINWQKRGLGKVVILRNSIAFSHAISLKLLIYLSLPCSFGRASQQKQFKLAKIFFLMQSAQLGKCNRNIGIMVGMLLLEYRMNFH